MLAACLSLCQCSLTRAVSLLDTLRVFFHGRNVLDPLATDHLRVLSFPPCHAASIVDPDAFSDFEDDELSEAETEFDVDLGEQVAADDDFFQFQLDALAEDLDDDADHPLTALLSRSCSSVDEDFRQHLARVYGSDAAQAARRSRLDSTVICIDG
eukprot:m.361342 g.361342  ORF g.361342 m.361342 type:complete len:155 (+) comp56004_c0_seq98:87-551(+)